jgi:uracil-DNA glycosylase
VSASQIQPVCLLEQEDRSPKRVFVLGVYASAVHARWVTPDGETRIKALAVASEPYIFWRGDGAEAIIRDIEVPPQAGRLLPASVDFNGPSGNALDELYLAPLGLTRADAWLCDLVPHSCANAKQLAAIEREYGPLMKRLDLLPATVPPVPRVLADPARRNAILRELLDSRAETLILLGDQPIRWLLRYFDGRWRRLSDFGTTPDSYGRRHAVHLGDQRLEILPLVHPRQAARLGDSSVEWNALHRSWVEEVRPR